MFAGGKRWQLGSGVVDCSFMRWSIAQPALGPNTSYPVIPHGTVVTHGPPLVASAGDAASFDRWRRDAIGEQFGECPWMVRQSGCHGRGAPDPVGPGRVGRGAPVAEAAMRPAEVVAA